MSPRQEIMAILLSVGLMVLIFELVRRRSLKEEYSWLWMLTGVTIFILAVWHGLLLSITRLIGAALPASTILFFGVFFLILINLYFSVKLSKLSNQVKELVQKSAVLSEKVERNLSRRNDQEP